MRTLLIAVSLIASLPISSIARPLQTGGASLEGRVVREGTGEPLAGARVTLTRSSASAAPPAAAASAMLTALAVAPSPGTVLAGASPASPATNAVSPATTGTDGRFVFRNVEPGQYRLQVVRNGFARQAYGQRNGAGPTALIRVAADQPVKDVVVALVPAGNVSGAIRDSNGQGQTGVPVQLLQAIYNSTGERTFQIAASAKTDDRGEYRLYWVTPGRYFLSAGTSSGPTRPLDANGSVGSPNEVPGQSFGLTYYPGVVDARAASIVEVNPGAELNGLSFVVNAQGLHSVRGRLVDAATGAPPAAASLSLAYRTLSGSSGAFSAGQKYDPVSGDFELRNVPPGSYVVQAIAIDAGSTAPNDTVLTFSAVATRPNARQAIEISNSDVEGVVLALASGVSIPGSLRVEAGTFASIPGWERIRVQLRPTVSGAFGPNLQPASPVAQAPGADGTFAITGVSPGEFLVGPITGLPAGFYVKEARFNQVDVLGQPLQFTGSASVGLEIVLGTKTGHLDGVAVDAQSHATPGVQVVLVPESGRNRPDLYKSALSDASGGFGFRNVPPGDYRVFAWEALDSYAYFDPDLLKRVEGKGRPVHISESPAAGITVNVIPANP